MVIRTKLIFYRTYFTFVLLLGAVVPVTYVAAGSESSEVQTAAVSSEPAPEETIDGIKARRREIDAQRKSVAERLSVAEAKALDSKAKWLERHLDALERSNATLSQQIAVLERLQTLNGKEKQLREEMAQLGVMSGREAESSFTALDRSREELNAEVSRKQTFAAKIKLATEASDEASKELRAKREALSEIEKAATAEEESPLPAAEAGLAAARQIVQAAEEAQRLAEFELRSEKKAEHVHKAHLDLLRKQVAFLEANATFSQGELQEHLRRIDKDAFDLNRQLGGAKERRITVKSRLERARKRLAAAPVETQKSVEVETEALRLELEALETEIDTAKRQVSLLEDAKTLWQRRYAVFNQMAAQTELPKWREAASGQLQEIEQDNNARKLWLSDWQSRLVTLTNKVENLTQAESAYTGWLKRQREHVQTIVDDLQTLATAFENSRRLHRKLIDEINGRTSLRTWSDWIDLAVNFEVSGNTLLDWCYAVASALITFMVLFFLRWILIRRLKHFGEAAQASLANGFLTSVKRANVFFFAMIAISIASMFLVLDAGISTIISRLTKVAFVLQAAIWASGFLRAWIFRILARKTKRDGASMGALSIFNFSSQVLLWSIALLLILQNLGVDVTALVAGLGIGGVAVALSLQRILNDLFSSLSIVLDKPFVAGDFVTFDEFFGTVEHIGIKTTRIRSLTGEQIVCANGDLLNARIRNFKRMRERRVTFNIGVVYQTPGDKLQQIPAMIKGIIEAQENVRFDRAHFTSYGDFALLFEVVYYVLSPDYNLYMDIQQAINLNILREFSAEGIEFAYPTQSLYLQNAPMIDQPEFAMNPVRSYGRT